MQTTEVSVIVIVESVQYIFGDILRKITSLVLVKRITLPGFINIPGDRVWQLVAILVVSLEVFARLGTDGQ